MVGAAHPWFYFCFLRPAVAIGLFATVVATAFGDVDLAANDGLDVALAGFIEEIRGREEIAVVGDGYRRHLLTGCFIEQFGSLASPVEQAVIRVYVQMYELRSEERRVGKECRSR